LTIAQNEQSQISGVVVVVVAADVVVDEEEEVDVLVDDEVVVGSSVVVVVVAGTDPLVCPRRPTVFIAGAAHTSPPSAAPPAITFRRVTPELGRSSLSSDMHTSWFFPWLQHQPAWQPNDRGPQGCIHPG
jgi:hypothetical protein